MPSATPADAEISGWNDLSRDEQLRRLRQVLTHPECGIDSGVSMADLLALAQKLASERRGG
jgi:hypothetical protein